MSTHNTANTLRDITMRDFVQRDIDEFDTDGDGETMAEVIELPVSEAPSFYQRNSGALPKSGAGLSNAHRRDHLPAPDNSDPNTLMVKIKGLFRR